MRHQLITHPLLTLAALLVLAFGFFQLSASGQPGTYWSDGPGWLGNTAWVLFLLCALGFLAFAGFAAVRRLHHRSQA